VYNKVTPEAKARCAAHTLQEQLEQLRTIHTVELTLLKKRQSQDQSDIEFAFDADKVLSEQYAKQQTGKGWDSSIEP